MGLEDPKWGPNQKAFILARGENWERVLSERKGLKELPTLSPGEGSDLSKFTQLFGDKNSWLKFFSVGSV